MAAIENEFNIGESHGPFIKLLEEFPVLLNKVSKCPTSGFIWLHKKMIHYSFYISFSNRYSAL